MGKKGLRPAVKAAAYGGISTALIMVLMLFSSLLPFMEYAIPAAAALIIFLFEKECGRKAGWICYAASALLCVLFLPNKEPAVLYALFFGYYPLLREVLNVRCRKWAATLCKYAVFNLMMIGAYAVLIFLFQLTELWEDINLGMRYGAVVLLLFGNIAFALYDLLLLRAEQLYQAKKMGLELHFDGYLARFFRSARSFFGKTKK